jgi:16S rRNA (guanine527-N7)-methyltransferase
MSGTALGGVLDARLARAGLDVSAVERELLLDYLGLLARWNRKVNLTAFDLTQPTDAAIDRLVVEPLAASAFVRPEDRTALDIGSGGGSPAVPLAIRCRHLRLTMVEARQKKAAFLREAVRTVGIDASVEAQPFETVSQALAERSVDVVTLRAVRPDARLLAAVARALSSDGRVVLFGFGQIAQNDIVWSRSEVDGFSFTVGRREG